MCNKNKITIIFSALNEGDEPINTIKSIYETADPELFDIIVFNDAGEWKEIPSKYDVKVIHNDIRQGICANIDQGVEMAKTPYIFICNARMRFKKDWLTKGMEQLEKEPKTLFCTTSLALRYDNTKTPGRKLYGADIYYIWDDKKYGKQILQAIWAKKKNKDIYEIPCVLGANYFITKQWYQYIKGFQGLSTWGGICEYISLKSWMAGGKCKIITSIEIGNIYRSKPTYTFIPEDKLYNKVFTAFALLDNANANRLLHQLYDKAHYGLIVNRLLYNLPTIREFQDYYKKIRINDCMNFIKKEN